MMNNFNNGFSILKSATNIEEVFSTKKKSKTNFYSLIWVTKGMIDLLLDDVLTPVNINQMIFITPLKYVKILENHGQASIIQFNREFYCIRENDHEVSCDGVLYFGTQGIPTIELDKKEKASFKRLLGVLEEEFEITDTIQEEMLRSILKKWLIKSTRIFKKQKNFIQNKEPKFELFRKFKLLLEKNYKKNHKVQEYANLLNKSPKTMANQFKLLGQTSPSLMIQQRIIAEAKRYLLYSNLTVKEISFKLGFDDPPSFSNYFKNKTSLAPKHFKEAYQKN